MRPTATSRQAGAPPGHAHVAARVAVSADLREEYRALGRRPVTRPVTRGDPARDQAEQARANEDATRVPSAGEVQVPASSAPLGGFPVRIRVPGAAPDTEVAVRVAPLVTHPALPTDQGWGLTLLVDPGGMVFARLTVALGPNGRSGTGEMVRQVATPDDLRGFLHGVQQRGPLSLAMSGVGAGLAALADCLTADGRLMPRPTG